MDRQLTIGNRLAPQIDKRAIGKGRCESLGRVAEGWGEAKAAMSAFARFAELAENAKHPHVLGFRRQAISLPYEAPLRRFFFP